MPRTMIHIEEEEPIPLTDLLRTGEASRLRRRGAMRGLHRREDSEELPMPLARRVRVDAAAMQHDAPPRREGQVYLELSCGVRTTQLTSTRSSSRRPSPLPQSEPLTSQPTSGFAFASTGCGAIVNSSASPLQPDPSPAHQVYISTNLSNTDVTRLSSRYLDPDQRSIAEFLSNEDCGCRCEWEAIGCGICGNPLGFLYLPCHPRHSLDNSRTSVNPIHIFFTSSVTPFPAYDFPPFESTRFRALPPPIALSESDDTSLGSPTFSPRVHMSSGSEAVNVRSPYRHPPEDSDLITFNWFTDADQALVPTAPASPTMPPRVESEPEPMSEHRTVTQRPRARREEPPPAAAAGTRPAQNVPSDDEWSVFLLGDRPTSLTRRYTESRESLHPWVPRERRERLSEGPPAMDPTATAAYPQSPDRPPSDLELEVERYRSPRGSQIIQSHWPPRHDAPTRWPSRYSTTLPTSVWSSTTRVFPLQYSRGSSHIPEHSRDNERERSARTSRWASPSTRIARRTSAPAVSSAAAAPPFTLMDSGGERSYPPSARSSIDTRDSLGVADPDLPVHHHHHSLFGPRTDEPHVRGGGDRGAHSEFRGWNSILRMEDSASGGDADDEEKADDERRAGDSLDHRRGNINGERTVNEQTESSHEHITSR